MDVRNAQVEPVVEHGGTCLSYFMVPKESVREATTGGYLEFVGEFELKPGSRLEPHRHDTDEYYYLLRGEAIMQVEDEQRRVTPGDLVHIPRNAVHSIWPAREDEAFRAFAFAVSYMPPGASHAPANLPKPKASVTAG
jgi:quercetin dioxygenase-like cupin family protein